MKPTGIAQGDDETRAAADSPRTPTITLKAALARARKDPPTVLRARAAHQRTLTELDYARAQYLPSLVGNGSYGYAYDNRLVIPGVPRIDSESLEARGSLGLEWKALDMARGDRSDQANASVQAAAYALRATEQQAMLAAAELFFYASAARELVRDAELSLSRRMQEHEAAVQLVEAGTRSPVDAQRAEIEVTSMRYMLELRKSEEHAALAALAVALGNAPTDWVHPVGSSSEGALSAGRRRADSAEEARKLAQASHPDVHLADAQWLTAREAHEAALSERMPVLGVTATASVSYLDVLRGAGIDGHQFGAVVGAFVRFNGFDPAVWSKADVAAAKVAEARGAQSELQQRIGAEAVKAFYALERAGIERRRSIAMLDAAQSAREAQRGRYLAGLSSMLELLDAEQLEQDARRRRIEAERDEVISLARLLAACGLLEGS